METCAYFAHRMGRVQRERVEDRELKGVDSGFRACARPLQLAGG